jgi:fibronectin type 3 domain-containing protein
MTRKITLLLTAIIMLLSMSCSDDNNPVQQVNGFISGRVTADGVGLAGVTITVSAYTHTGGGLAKSQSQSSMAETAADGDYRIELLPGQYKVEYDKILDGEPLHTARYPIAVLPASETVVNVDLKDPVPANLIAGDDDAAVLLTWESAYHTEDYRVYRATPGQADFQLVDEALGWSGTVRIINVPPDIGSYLYRITGVIDDIESEPSNEAEVEFTATIKPPSGFQASDQITHVALIWTPKDNAAYYKVYRAVSTPESWQVLDSTAQSSFSDVPETYQTYYYYVTAVSALSTESGPSSTEMVVYDGRYDPPSGLTLIDRGSNFYLTWLAENNVGYYNVYRSPEPDADFVVLDSTSSTHYEDFPNIHQYYYYQVTIVGPNGLESEPSSTVEAYFDGRLDPPDQVLATDIGLYVAVSWSEVLWTGAYVLYRSDDGQTYHQIARLSAVYLNYNDIPPEAGNYLYKVSTETVDGVEGPLSSAASVFFSDNLMRPENVVAENFGTFVVASWDSVADADGYTVYRSTSAGGGYVEIGSAIINRYDDIPQSAGPYYYKIRATDDLGHESPFSFYAYTYFTARPLPPHDVQAHDYLYRIQLSWGSEDPAYNFIIYRANSSIGEYIPVDTVETMYGDDWPSAAGHYYYRIQALSAPDVVSDLSDYAHVYFSGILEMPAGLTGEDVGSYVQLDWQNVVGASEYDVYRGTSPEDLDIIQTVYDTGATDAPDAAGTYYYAVTAKTQGGLESPRSAPVIVEFDPQ